MRRWLWSVALGCVFPSCFQPMGLIYTEVTTPLDVNFDRTPVYDTSREGDVKHFRLYLGLLSFMWDTNAIADIANKRGGIDEIYYADHRRVSVFFGIWSQEYIEIYGHAAPPPPKASAMGPTESPFVALGQTGYISAEEFEARRRALGK